MYLLHNIGPRLNSNYNNRDEIIKCQGILSFDGVYRSVFFNQDVLVGKQVILFVTGNYIGGNNQFDSGMPFEEFCNWDEIRYLQHHYNCEIGWHTWSHRNLTLLSDDEVLEELKAPFPMKHVAYPYGNVDTRVARLADEAGFEYGWSVSQGDGSKFQLNRKYLNW